MVCPFWLKVSSWFAEARRAVVKHSRECMTTSEKNNRDSSNPWKSVKVTDDMIQVLENVQMIPSNQTNSRRSANRTSESDIKQKSSSKSSKPAESTETSGSRSIFHSFQPSNDENVSTKLMTQQEIIPQDTIDSVEPIQLDVLSKCPLALHTKPLDE